jgi:hypothetical protein
MRATEVNSLVEADAQQAVHQYGGALQVRRRGHPLYGRTVQVSKVHLVYEHKGAGQWGDLIQRICDRANIEVHFE